MINIFIYSVEDDFEVDFQEASCLSLHILRFLRIYIYIHTWKQVSLNPFGRWALAPSKTCWGCIVNLHMQGRPNKQSIKNWMGPYQRTPKEFDRAIRYSGWGVRSVGAVGDFLEAKQQLTTISSERKERMNGKWNIIFANRNSGEDNKIPEIRTCRWWLCHVLFRCWIISWGSHNLPAGNPSWARW